MDSFTPIAYVYYEIIEELKSKGIDSIVHFFKAEKEIDSVRGKIETVLKEKDGDFLLMNTGEKVRLDKIITIFGKPGPAFDLYDSYANSCMDCMGGMD
jgi:uncharacterized ferredoxin-like protein